MIIVSGRVLWKSIKGEFQWQDASIGYLQYIRYLDASSTNIGLQSTSSFYAWPDGR